MIGFVQNMTDIFKAHRRNDEVKDRKQHRDRAEFDLNQHRDTCRVCAAHGSPELVNGAGCPEGQRLAIVFHVRNRAVTG